MDTKGIKRISNSGPDQFRVYVRVNSKHDQTISCQREKAKGIATEKEALRVRDELLAEAQREVTRREFAGAMWGTLVENWEDGTHTGKIFMSRPLTKNTLEDYSQALRNHTRDWWQLPASEITPGDIARLLHRIANDLGKSRAVQLKIRSAINTVFEWAIDEKKIKNVHQSPAKGVSLSGRKVEKRPQILNEKEIRLLMEAAFRYNHDWREIWLFSVLTGARSGESYALEWTDVDLEHRRLYITKSFSKRVNAIGPTKAGYWREVPINDDLARLLKELRAKAGGSKYVLPRIKDWDRGQQAKVLRTFCAVVGIPSVNFHALRACFATQLLRNGVAAPQVMKICGWKELDTMQRYIRLAGVEIEGVTDSLKFTPADDAVAKVVNLFGPKE